MAPGRDEMGSSGIRIRDPAPVTTPSSLEKPLITFEPKQATLYQSPRLRLLLSFINNFPQRG